MKILHISDTHGMIPELRDRDQADVIVHSGDLMPNRSYGIRAIEETFQSYWLEHRGKELAERIGDKPFIYCPGNHDYVNPIPILQGFGVDARGLCDTFLDVNGVGFYGFPWVPKFFDWNYMDGPEERRQRLTPAVELMEQGVIDVFVAHGPMYGVLDRTAAGDRAGSHVMRETMQAVRHPPKLFLHGHIHEAAGVQGWSRGIIVSNAACTQRLLTLETHAGEENERS